MSLLFGLVTRLSPLAASLRVAVRELVKVFKEFIHVSEGL